LGQKRGARKAPLFHASDSAGEVKGVAMRFKSSCFSVGLWIVLLVFGFCLLPVRVAANHELEEVKEAIEASLKKTFEDFNKDDYVAFADGWTDAGFMNKKMFDREVNGQFAKDDLPRFFGPIKLRGPIEVLNISNIRILDHMMARATVELDIRQGNVRERYGLVMVKRLALDKRYKINKDMVLPLRPDGYPVVQLKMTEFHFELDNSRLARNMVLQLVNAGKMEHEFMVFKKVMPADWENFIARGAWFLKPGEATELVLTGLEPGDYAMVCCNTEVGGDNPHCAKGMRVEFAIK
jgi:uncharacterized cupredoxin-like copper-binding protein